MEEGAHPRGRLNLERTGGVSRSPNVKSARHSSGDRYIREQIQELEEELQKEREINEELRHHTADMREEVDAFYNEDREKLIGYYETRLAELTKGRPPLPKARQYTTGKFYGAGLRESYATGGYESKTPLGGRRPPEVRYLKGERERMVRELRNLEDEIKRALNERTKLPAYEKEVEELQKELDQLTKRNELSIDPKMLSLSVAREKNSCARAEEQTVRNKEELVRWQSRFAFMASEMDKTLRLTLNPLKEEYNDLQKKISLSERGKHPVVEDLRNQIDQANKALGEKEKMGKEFIASLPLTIEKLKREAREAEERIAAQKAENDRVRQLIAEKEAQGEELQDRIVNADRYFDQEKQAMMRQLEKDLSNVSVDERRRWQTDLSSWMNKAATAEDNHITDLTRLRTEIAKETQREAASSPLLPPSSSYLQGQAERPGSTFGTQFATAGALGEKAGTRSTFKFSKFG